METINLINNTDFNVSSSSADDNATLNRYLTTVLTFKTRPSLELIAKLPVKGQSELRFPITLSATGEGKFALKKNHARRSAWSIGFGWAGRGRRSRFPFRTASWRQCFEFRSRFVRSTGLR